MKFIYGNILKDHPRGIAPPEAWPEFGMIAGPEPICRKELVGNEPKGVRWSLWPLTFEEYVSDSEPDLAKSKEGALARNRIIMWKRIGRTDIPKEWHRSSDMPWRIDGFHEIAEGTDYISRWQHNARRDSRIWKERYLDKAYAIQEIPLEEFESAYRRSTSWRTVGVVMLDTFKRRLELPERHGCTTLWGVRNLKTGDVIAGTAALFSPTHRASVRECPFMLPEARGVYAATGLIDHWFQEAEKRGTKTLFFTSFWHEEEPRSWKKFSEFKSHFGLSYIAYPPLLWRFERGSLF